MTQKPKPPPKGLSSRQDWIIRSVLFIVCLLPLLRLVLGGFMEQLGTNPAELIIRSLGTWTLVLLCITLSVTPLRRLFGWNILLRYRRTFGLFTFFYVSLHFLSYAWLDQGLELDIIIQDVIKRPFITIGFLAWLLLLPLAITSNNSMIRRLGSLRWRKLHSLVYGIIILGVIHYIWLVKSDLTQPLIYASVAAVLLGLRIWWWSARASPAKAK